MKSPEEKIILMTPQLLKTIKKALPQIRSPYVAKELMGMAVKIATELKQIPAQKITK